MLIVSFLNCQVSIGRPFCQAQPQLQLQPTHPMLSKKKYYLDSEIVPISSDTPTIGPVSEHLDSEYWSIFLTPLPTNVIGK